MTGQQALVCGYSLCPWHCSVWDAHVGLSVRVCVCVCRGRRTGRRPEAEHWSHRTTGVSTHATDPVTLTSIMTAGLILREWPGAQREDLGRTVARRAAQQGPSNTVCCSSYSSCNTEWYVSTPSFLMGFSKLPIIHWHCKEHPLPLSVSLFLIVMDF